MRRIEISGPGFTFWMAHELSAEERSEIAHLINRVLLDPPRAPQKARQVAIKQALAQYHITSASTRRDGS